MPLPAHLPIDPPLVEPLSIYKIVIQVFTAVSDARTNDIRKEATEYIEEQASYISEKSLRDAYHSAAFTYVMPQRDAN